MSGRFREVIRIARTNIDGTKQVCYALADIRGVGIRLADVVAKKAGLDSDTGLGFLSSGEVGKMESIPENPAEHDIPGWLLNRQNDRETGNDVHLIGPEIDLHVKSYIILMKRTSSWKGYRYSYRLRVRGQKTRTTGRSRKALGVRKEKAVRQRL